MRKQGRLSYFVVAILFAGSAFAQNAGEVIFAKGTVTAERAPPVALTKGDAVLVQDVVATGEASRAQLLMLDGAKVAIRPNSRVRIEEFAFPSGANAPPGQPVVTTSDDRSVTSLLKGGFRTITGAIGKDHEESYEVRTPVGVLGIRGTSFSVLFCSGDCGSTAAGPVADGLYIGVTEGIVFFRNEFGEIEIRAGEFVFIPLTDRRPRRLQRPPAVLLDEQDLGFDAAPVRDPGADDDPSRPPDDDDQSRPPTASGGSAAGFNTGFSIRRVPESATVDPQTGEPDEGSDSSEPQKQPIIGTDPDGTPVDITPGDTQPPGNRTISYSTGPLGLPDAAFSGTQVNGPGEYRLDPGNNSVLGFVSPYPGTAAPDTGVFDIGTATNAEVGFDSVTVLRWGRWSGGTADITLTGGVDASQDLGNQSIHWVSGPDNGAPPVMPITGAANYSLIGNTSPTDNFGNVGVLGSASFQADFTRQVVTSTVTLDINSFNWTAAGTGTIGAQAGLPAHLFQGLYNNVTITGAAGTFIGTGMFSGFFSEPGPTSDPSYPGGVGMTYSLQDQGASMSVSGGLVFGNPQ